MSRAPRRDVHHLSPRHAEATIDGVRIHWVELGAADGNVPLVLLHGLYDCHRTWKYVAPELARERRVLMPDLPGHGLSDRPDASYKLDWYARVTSRWLESLGLHAVDVVGHSFGGGVAQMLLLECAERIRRLILAASGGLGREIHAALRLASTPRVVETLGQRFMALGTHLVLLRDPGFTVADAHELARVNAAPGSARAFARTVRDVIDWRGQRRVFFDRAHEIPRLPPIAVLWGVRDKIIPVDHGRAFAEALEGVVYVPFDRCGHYVHREEPDAFVRTVRELLHAPTARRVQLRADPVEVTAHRPPSARNRHR